LRGWDVETGANVVVRVSFLFCFQLRAIHPLSFSSVSFKQHPTQTEHHSTQ
jgi:hypothetical protein